ncbi:MAG TPA: stage V sporulation protein AC [Candidatus Onthenecus intestinigallinarum]|uniref:Stage V sporulation protein AC n=1 Tax=Candidatus Onthenecus intestinigallinarum TaxID=2840875 RepID=A0A9D1CQU8_9FIRM|nr:stage V sporulation protein AC [Candidatus Onthenecus intestinigallinarum]
MKQSRRVQEYLQLVERLAPRSDMGKGLVRAFWVGGLICVLGQAITDLAMSLGLDRQAAGAVCSISLVFASALTTGLGVYDRLGKYAGAGSIVPITGFANSVVAPAMEFKREGYVMGVGAKMFSLAGPVLVYGIGSSVIVGLIYFFLGR